jgi:hypothetical protein
LTHPTSREENLEQPPSYDQLDLPVRLILVQPPNIFKTEHVFRRKTYYKIHTPTLYGIIHLRGVYQQDQLRCYTKLYAVVQFDYLEVQFLLNGIGPSCIDTWALWIANH